MRLLEYQAKELFSEFGIKVPKGKTSKDIEQGKKDAAELGYPFVIKSQVPVGGRGKAVASPSRLLPTKSSKDPSLLRSRKV